MRQFSQEKYNFEDIKYNKNTWKVIIDKISINKDNTMENPNIPKKCMYDNRTPWTGIKPRTTPNYS